MATYELSLLLHIVGAIVWIGAGMLMAILGTRAILAADPSRVLAFAEDSEWLGLRVFLPANLIVLVSGFLLVEDGNWSYGPVWIKLGLVGFGVSFATGAAFFGPGWARVRTIAEREGTDSIAVGAAVRRLLLGSWIDVGLLLAVVFVMTVKPTSSETGVLAIAAAISAAFALVGLVLLRARSQHAAQPPFVAEPP